MTFSAVYLDPTVRALLLLARTEMDDALRTRALALLPRVDWERLLQMAQTGGVLGQVAESLEGLHKHLTPAPMAHLLLRERLRAEVNNRLLVEETIRLSQAARQQGLTIAPLKGVALLMDGTYPRLDARTMCDIDLLAQRSQYLQVERLLLSLGYEADRRHVSMRHEHHVLYHRQERSTRLVVELHWTPFFTLYGTPRQDSRVFRGLVSCSFEGETLSMLDSEDMLLSLLSHLHHHRFRGPLKWAVDVPALLDRVGPDFNWARFRRRASALGAGEAMAYSLAFVEQLLRPCPRIPRQLQSRLRTWLLDRFNSPREIFSNRPQPALWQRTIIDLLLQDRARDGLRYLLYKLPELYERGHAWEAPSFLIRGGPERRS